jgi:putative phage-type endonuclease
MTAITHNLEQGSPAWHAFRAKSYGASEAPIMAGKSKYQTRTDLVKQKATGIIPDVDAGKQFLFDKGHAAEVGGRAMAEKILGEELSPVVMSDDVDGLPLSASLDGITFGDEIIFEHKLYSEALADQIAAGNLDEHYTIQMDQQLLISGAEKCLFMASDGTPANVAHMWYTTTKKKCDMLVVGWLQFQKDVADYVPTAEAAPVTAEAVMALPALAVQIKGEVTASNLPVFVSAADAFLARIKTVLENDQDFADAEANVKACKSAEDGIEQTKKAITAQATSIDEVIRTMDLYKEKLSTVRLKLDKLVKSEKEARKLAIVSKADKDYADHVIKLESEVKPIGLNRSTTSGVRLSFVEAIKGLKKLSAMQEAVDTALRDAKFAADQEAADVRAKLLWCKENAAGQSALFPDLQSLMAKPMEDFTLTITSRIEKQKADEAARLEAERTRMEAEAKAKAEREAAAKLAAEEARIRAEEQAKARAEAVALANREQQAANEREERAQNNHQSETVMHDGAQPAAASQTEPAAPVSTVRTLVADFALSGIAADGKEGLVRIRPDDQALIDAIAERFNVSYGTACDWVMETAERMKVAA